MDSYVNWDAQYGPKLKSGVTANKLVTELVKRGYKKFDLTNYIFPSILGEKIKVKDHLTDH